LAPIFPTWMAETPERLGVEISRHAVGLQISAATLGSAAMPAAVGLLVTARSPEAIGGALVVAALALFALQEALSRTTRT
jgi:hypothetical protein